MSEGSSVTLIFSKCRKELSFFGFFFSVKDFSFRAHCPSGKDKAGPWDVTVQCLSVYLLSKDKLSILTRGGMAALRGCTPSTGSHLVLARSFIRLRH